MSITTTRRLTSALVAVAAAGSLAVGIAGTASADPGAVKTARFWVANNTSGPVRFMSIMPGSDLPVQGPKAQAVVEQGKSVWFDIQVWPKGGHTTSAFFQTDAPKDVHSWGVDMRASDAANQARCHQSSSACSATDWTQTNTITLS
jgi:hypothetical protein